MRFSVIVTLFNTADYLPACVRSVLDQADGDTELILIDDGSTDSSWSVGQSLAATDPRIRLARQSNQGPSVARNHGLALATGEYVTFVDSDDTLAPETLARCAALLATHRPEILIHSMQHLTGNDPAPAIQSLHLADRVYASTESLITDLLAETRLLLYSAANKFYLRSFLQRHDLRFLSGCDFGEDRLFNFASLHQSPRVVTTSHVGYRYHIRPRPSLTRRFRPNHIGTLLHLHEEKRHLIGVFARDPAARDRYLALDLLWELRAAWAHLQQHWSGLSRRERYREIRALSRATYPVYFDRLPQTTVPRRLVRFALRHRLTPLLYLLFACGLVP